MWIAIAALIYGGWKSWPWWSPIAALAALIPFTLLKLVVVNDWRAESGLRTIDALDFGLSMLVNLAVLYAFFLLARGLRILVRGPVSASPSPAPRPPSRP